MDRDDARFVAYALDSRISGDRETLDQLAASSRENLIASAARVRALAADWSPALVAAAELESIAEVGAGTLTRPRSLETLQIFVDKLIELVIEPSVPRNRAARRMAAAKLPRAERRALERTVH